MNTLDCYSSLFSTVYSVGIHREAQIVARNDERTKQRQEQHDKRHAQKIQRFDEKMAKKHERDAAELNKRMAKLAEVSVLLFSDLQC